MARVSQSPTCSKQDIDFYTDLQCPAMLCSMMIHGLHVTSAEPGVLDLEDHDTSLHLLSSGETRMC